MGHLLQLSEDALLCQSWRSKLAAWLHKFQLDKTIKM